jgi:hypothetical protein
MNSPSKSTANKTFTNLFVVIILLAIGYAVVYYAEPHPQPRAAVQLRHGEEIETVNGVTTDGWLTECETGNRRHVVGDYTVVQQVTPVVCVNEPHYKEWVKAEVIKNLPVGWNNGVRQHMDLATANRYLEAVDWDKEKAQELATQNGWITGGEQSTPGPNSNSNSTNDIPLWVGILFGVGVFAFVGFLVYDHRKKTGTNPTTPPEQTAPLPKALSNRAITITLTAVIAPRVVFSLWIIFR